jgi:hypothetical protein
MIKIMREAIVKVEMKKLVLKFVFEFGVKAYIVRLFESLFGISSWEQRESLLSRQLVPL